MKETINDLDLSFGNWKNYNDILTDSLWLFDKRDNSGEHEHGGNFHGNFIPQIPQQLIKRYTKEGDWVLDPFYGSGTTLIEAERQKRNSIGIDISIGTIRLTSNNIIDDSFEDKTISYTNNGKIRTVYIKGDSADINTYKPIRDMGIKKVQLCILHPPYHQIIKFTKNPADLSNQESLEDFLKLFGKVVNNCHSLLENNRYMAVVIGDYYKDSQWIPLGFYCMDKILKNIYFFNNECKIVSKFILKGIVVKNYGETAGKGKNTSLWRFRALKNNGFVFKHEYLLIMQKITEKIKGR